MNLNEMQIIEVAKRLGLNLYKNYMCSCFNKSGHENGDRNPSLSFNPKTNKFKCFACGVHGNNVELVKLGKGIDSGEAMDWLRKEFNYDANNSYYSSEQRVVLDNDKNVSSKDIEIYNKFFELAGDIDNKHWAYLKDRGFSKLVLDYGVTNVKRDTEEAIKNYFTMEELLHSGIFSLSKKKKPYFTFFNWTLLFPFYFEDDIVYIQSRTIEDAKQKYRNLSKTITYPYNVNILLHSDIGKDKVLVCEGAIDTLTLLDNGYNAIGVLGAKNFKCEWVKLFDKYEVTPIIAFDNDTAGDSGAEILVSIFKRSLTRYKPKNAKDWNGLR